MNFHIWLPKTISLPLLNLKMSVRHNEYPCIGKLLRRVAIMSSYWKGKSSKCQSFCYVHHDMD